MKIILVNENISDACRRALQRAGFFPIELPSDPSINSAVRSHPDTLILRIDGNLVTTADYCDAAAYIFSDLREICDVKISFTADTRGTKYPSDAVLNGLAIGKKLFVNTQHFSTSATEIAKSLGYTICHVNQGYPACTVLAFGQSAITADRGMADALSKQGINVTLISNGHISLPPYEYGFIGGASAVCDGNVYFFGDVSAHPDYVKIKEAIEREGFRPISLSDEPLIDLGGAIVI